MGLLKKKYSALNWHFVKFELKKMFYYMYLHFKPVLRHSNRALLGLCYSICSPTLWYVHYQPWELFCVEMVDNVCMRAYRKFDLICVHFPHMTDLKWTFSNVKINSESIGGVVFPDTCTHLLLNEQFLTLTCKDVS